MNGKIFQIQQDADDPIGLLWCSDENFDEDLVSYHWGEYDKTTDDPILEEFSDYISEKTNELFKRIFVDEVYV